MTKMKVAFLDLKCQYREMGGKINTAVKRVLDSGWYILGGEVSAFEDEFANYCGSKYAIGVASGTEALYISLAAAGVKPGDEVITAPNAGVPSTVAIELAGAVPVFVDVERETYNISPVEIRKKVSKKTKAVIPTHLYGQCADMDPINALAKKKGIAVIEDACQAHGAAYKGRKAGSLSDMGCFSFYPTKNLGCYGDGGMITTSDRKLAEKVLMIRDYGQVRRYVHKIKGINSRLDELQAAVLRVKLSHLDLWNKKRAVIAGKYNAGICNEAVNIPFEAGYGKHVYHLYVVTSPQRNALKEHLKERGVESLVHYPSVVYMQKAYKKMGKTGRTGVAEELCRQVLSLPLYPEMSSEEIDNVCKAVNSFRG